MIAFIKKYGVIGLCIGIITALTIIGKRENKTIFEIATPIANTVVVTIGLYHILKEKNKDRPQVIAYLQKQKTNLINLVIKNVGTSHAKNVSVEVIADFPVSKRETLKEHIINWKNMNLPINKRRTTFYTCLVESNTDDGSYKEFLDKKRNTVAKVKITYENKYGEKYSDIYSLEVNSYINESVVETEKFESKLLREFQRLNHNLFGLQHRNNFAEETKGGKDTITDIFPEN